jgi:hypothetical protein
MTYIEIAALIIIWLLGVFLNGYLVGKIEAPTDFVVYGVFFWPILLPFFIAIFAYQKAEE